MILNIASCNYYSLRQFFLGLLITLTMISCVTINIYFPAAAAEEAAEKIVDEVLNIETAPKPQSMLKTHSNDLTIKTAENNQLIIRMVDFLIPAAYAAQANISIETAKIRSLRNRMKKRQSRLLPYYQAGIIGFTNNGLISTIAGKKISAKEKSTANKLIKAENTDRNNLYREIANANGHPEWQADIQKTFSQTWINKISSGWMYQNTSGKWQKK